MLKVYTSNEIADQNKKATGDLEFGLQGANTFKPLAFYVNGDNSAITYLDAVEYDQFRIEVARISLDTALIEIDNVNNIYNVDGSVLYDEKLTNGIYRFEFENTSEIPYKTEYFKVKEKEILIKCDTNSFTCDTELISCDQIIAII